MLTIEEDSVTQKKFFYLAGLPRTGSTVLGEILNQNAHIHVSPASPLSEIISDVLAKWKQNENALRAYKHPDQLANVWRGIREGMYRHREENIIVDKSWSWHRDDAIESMREILGEEPKVICTVDSVADCLASFIMLIRTNPDYKSFVDDFLLHENIKLTDENRCQAMMDTRIATSVGWCYANLKKTWSGPNRKNLLIIERTDLIANPEVVIDKIYDFIGCNDIASWGDNESHYFNGIQKEITEDDGAAYGIPNLHKLGPQLRDRTWKARDVLGNSLAFKYRRMEFWRDKKKPRK
jgi:sulfotransferase